MTAAITAHVTATAASSSFLANLAHISQKAGTAVGQAPSSQNTAQ